MTKVRDNIPFVLLFVRVGKENDFLVVREYQAERAFDAIRDIEFDVAATSRRDRRRWSQQFMASHFVVFNGLGLLKVYSSNSFLGDVVEGDKVSTNDTEMSTAP